MKDDPDKAAARLEDAETKLAAARAILDALGRQIPTLTGSALEHAQAKQKRTQLKAVALEKKIAAMKEAQA